MSLTAGCSYQIHEIPSTDSKAILGLQTRGRTHLYRDLNLHEVLNYTYQNTTYILFS